MCSLHAVAVLTLLDSLLVLQERQISAWQQSCAIVHEEDVGFWCTDIVLFNLIIFTSNSLFCLLIGRYYLYFLSPAAPGRILPSPGPCSILYLPRSACQSRSTVPCWPATWRGLAAAPHMPSLIPIFMSHRFSVFAMVQQLLMAISNRPLHCIATTCPN